MATGSCFSVLEISRPILVLRAQDQLCLVLDVDDSVLDSVLSFNDSGTWDKTILRPANVSYILEVNISVNS